MCTYDDLTDSLGSLTQEPQAPNWLHFSISGITSIILSYAAFHMVSGNPSKGLSTEVLYELKHLPSSFSLKIHFYWLEGFEYSEDTD